MKKIISLTLITIMILAATVLPIFAMDENENFTSKEAIALFEGAHALHYSLLNMGHRYMEGAPYFECDPTDTIKVDGEYGVFLKMLSYNYENSTYGADTEEKLKLIVGNYYSNNVIDGFIYNIQNDDSMLTLYINEDKQTYLQDGGFAPFAIYEVVGSSNFKINGNTATIELDLYRTAAPTVEHYLNYPVEFVKTDEGWRFADVMFDELYTADGWRKYVYKTPNTGDTTVTTAALLTTIALAAVITPFALSKKRRAR